MKTLDLFYKKELRELEPYSPIEPLEKIASRLDLPEDQIIKLDANENPYGISKEVLKSLGKAKYLNIYPDPAQKKTRNLISNYVGCDPENILVGAGADELIDLLCRLTLNNRDKVLTFVPTFSYYKHVIQLNSAEIVEIPRDDHFAIDLSKLNPSTMNQVKIVLLCSPNNPTGNLISEQVLDFFLNQNCLVVLDEAYYEFSEKSFWKKTETYENLFVLRTFSKCFGLAGLRLGYSISSPALAKTIMKIKPPYSVNMAAEIALEACLNQLPLFESQLHQIRETRSYTAEALMRIPHTKVFPSDANYILCRLSSKKAKEIKQKLEVKGILVRYFETEYLNNCLRFSIGIKPQMEILLQAFKFLMKE